MGSWMNADIVDVLKWRLYWRHREHKRSGSQIYNRTVYKKTTTIIAPLSEECDCLMRLLSKPTNKLDFRLVDFLPTTTQIQFDLYWTFRVDPFCHVNDSWFSSVCTRKINSIFNRLAVWEIEMSGWIRSKFGTIDSYNIQVIISKFAPWMLGLISILSIWDGSC